MALWTPAEITTALWLDAADSDTITESGGAVSQWADKSGNGYLFSEHPDGGYMPTTGAETLNGKNVLTFYDQTLQEQSSSYVSAQAAFVVVANLDGSGESPTVAALLGDSVPEKDHLFVLTNTSEYAISVDGSAGQTGYAGVNGQPLSAQGGDIDLGLTITEKAGPNLWVAQWDGANQFNRVASLVTHQSYLLRGAIAEVVLIHSAPTVADRQKIEGYLAHKWGLEANLPADHPYKSVPPQDSTFSPRTLTPSPSGATQRPSQLVDETREWRLDGTSGYMTASGISSAESAWSLVLTARPHPGTGTLIGQHDGTHGFRVEQTADDRARLVVGSAVSTDVRIFSGWYQDILVSHDSATGTTAIENALGGQAALTEPLTVPDTDLQVGRNADGTGHARLDVIGLTHIDDAAPMSHTGAVFPMPELRPGPALTMDAYSPSAVPVPNFDQFDARGIPTVVHAERTDSTWLDQVHGSGAHAGDPAGRVSIQARAAELWGTVTINGTPGRRQVVLFDARTLQPIREAWSAEDGAYRFTDLDPRRRYLVMARDHSGEWAPVAVDNAQPEIPE